MCPPPPREDAVRRGPPASPGKRPPQEPASPADTSILDFYPPDCEKRNFCCSRDPLCSVLLQQPEQTNTGGKGGVAKPVTPPTREAGLPQDSLERCRFTQRRGRGSSGVYPPTPGGHWVRVALSRSDQCEGKPRGGGAAGAGSCLPAECTRHLGRSRRTLRPAAWVTPEPGGKCNAHRKGPAGGG